MWLMLAVVCGTLTALQLGDAEQTSLHLALERGASMLAQIESMHDWSARHDGIQVAADGSPGVAASAQTASPGATSSDERRSARIVPTRTITEIAELAAERAGARIELIAPGTRSQGRSHPGSDGAVERIERVNDRDGPVFRYQAPLRVGPSCRACHATDVHPPGQFRTAIRLTMPATEALATLAAGTRRTMAAGAIGFVLLGSLVHLALRRQQAMVQRLVALTRSQAEEIDARTSEIALQRERYQRFAELSSDWFWEQDEHYRFVAFSGEHHNKGGLPSALLLGKTRWELDLLGVSDDEIAHHRSIVEAHRDFDGFEYQFVNADKELRWYSISGRPQFDADGRFTGYIGTAVDVTTRKRREQMLQTLTGDTATVFGAAFFDALAASLRKLLEARFCLVSRLPEGSSLARVVTFSDALGEISIGEYPVKDSPCSWVLDGDICIFPDSADQAFPKSALLRELGASSYIGVPIGTAGAKPLGILAVMDPGPLRLERDLTELVRIFASRAMIEFERMDSEHALRESARLLNLAEKMAHVGSWELDLGDRSLLWSQETYRIFGVDRRSFDCSFEGFLACVHPDDRTLVRETFAASIGSGDGFEIEHRIRRADGTVRTLLQRGEIRSGDDGRPTSVQGMMQDISERRESEQKLLLAASVFSAAHDGVLITDPDGVIIDANPSICLASGYEYQELVGNNPRIFQSSRQDAAFYRELWQTLASHGYWEGEIWNLRRDGQLVPERVSISAVCNDRGRVTHYIGVYTDISALKAQQQELERQAHIDPLTGLPNRRLLMDRIRLALAQAERSGAQPALAFIDLDGFKPVNDRYGHDAGDELLIEIARRLGHAVRAGDTVARLGGDEFVLLLVGVLAAQEIEATLGRVLEQIRQPILLAGNEVSLSASIGVARYPKDGVEAEALLQHADAEMYAAKHGGRNCYSPIRD